MTTTPCDNCGSPRQDRHRGPSWKYGKAWCSDKPACLAARQRHVESLKPKVDGRKGNCVNCGAIIKAGASYCLAEPCVRERNRVRMKIYAAKKRAEGINIFAPYYNSPGNKASRARRRARLADATTEKFEHAEIYERDAWICGICAKPVDPTLRWPDVMSVSLDHIVPLSRGGAHTRDNVQCSHLTCNAAKGNRG